MRPKSYLITILIAALALNLFVSPVVGAGPVPNSDPVVDTEKSDSNSGKTVLIIAGVAIVGVVAALIIKHKKDQAKDDDGDDEFEPDEDSEWPDNDNSQGRIDLNSVSQYAAKQGLGLFIDLKDINRQSELIPDDYKLENQQLTLGVNLNF